MRRLPILSSDPAIVRDDIRPTNFDAWKTIGKDFAFNSRARPLGSSLLLAPLRANALRLSQNVPCDTDSDSLSVTVPLPGVAPILPLALYV